MKKKVFLSAALLALMAVGALAQQYNSESDFQVTKTGNAITITGYTGSATVVNIPPTIQNTPVTRIEHNAFFMSNITSATIPNGVTSIGYEAFSNCRSLASITISNTVTSIERGAFYGCDSLTTVTFQGTIPSSGFSNDTQLPPFPNYLRDDFYAANAANGTPGTYTKTGTGRNITWTRR